MKKNISHVQKVIFSIFSRDSNMFSFELHPYSLNSDQIHLFLFLLACTLSFVFIKIRNPPLFWRREQHVLYLSLWDPDYLITRGCWLNFSNIRWGWLSNWTKHQSVLVCLNIFFIPQYLILEGPPNSLLANYAEALISANNLHRE